MYPKVTKIKARSSKQLISFSHLFLLDTHWKHLNVLERYIMYAFWWGAGWKVPEARHSVISYAKALFRSRLYTFCTNKHTAKICFTQHIRSSVY